MSRVAALLVLFSSVAVAAPPERVLLADPDPELLHAVESSLSPWKLVVVVERDAPRDDTIALARAEGTGARFVVWRERDQLVVFDRARDASERRPVRAGSFDAVSAAAAALTVKTMMRLPPPPPEEAIVIAAPTPRTGSDHVEIRVEANAAARVAPSGDDDLGGRALLAVMVRPSSYWDWRVGLRADIGTSTTIDAAGFKGTWREAAITAAASWTYERGNWEVEPWIGVGGARGRLDGTEMMTTRNDSDTMFTVRGGAYVRRRFASFTAGFGLELVGTPGAPTYTKTTSGMGAPTLFEASKFSMVVGFALAVDLGR